MLRRLCSRCHQWEEQHIAGQCAFRPTSYAPYLGPDDHDVDEVLIIQVCPCVPPGVPVESRLIGNLDICPTCGVSGGMRMRLRKQETTAEQVIAERSEYRRVQARVAKGVKFTR